MKVEAVKKEIEKEKNLEAWAKRCSNHFTKKENGMLFQDIDNMFGMTMKGRFENGAS